MAERTKRCTRCQTVKPWSDYYAKTRWDDGSVRTAQGYCKACSCAAVQTWRKTNWQRARELDKAAHDRFYSNPENVAKDRMRNRDRLRKQRGTSPNMYRRSRWQPEASQQRSVRVPVEPFAAWLRTLGETGADIARATHLPERSVWRILNEQKRVELDTVDRALLAVGDGTTLESLYTTEELAA